MSAVIATYAYSGPPVDACGNPTLTIAAGGSDIAFLTTAFDPITRMITISLPDKTIATLGDYILSAIFTEPGDFTFPLGLTLEVFDPCLDSVFPSAPVLTPDMENYYTNQGDLVVQTTFAQDSVTAAAMDKYVCGGYTITAVLNSGQSTITSGSVDPALTKIVSSIATQLLTTQFTFSSN